jgi:hypothetical protein
MLAALAAFLVLSLGTAQAAAITWTFDGSIGGAFDYDADTNTYSNVNFSFFLDPYTSVLGTSSATELHAVGNAFGDTMDLTYGAALTNAGGVVSYSGAADLNSTHTDFIPVAGNLTAVGVPEPATWGLMILGFGGLGFAARRRRVTA